MRGNGAGWDSGAHPAAHAQEPLGLFLGSLCGGRLSVAAVRVGAPAGDGGAPSGLGASVGFRMRWMPAGGLVSSPRRALHSVGRLSE
jgi:hypothetical protein